MNNLSATNSIDQRSRRRTSVQYHEDSSITNQLILQMHGNDQNSTLKDENPVTPPPHYTAKCPDVQDSAEEEEEEEEERMWISPTELASLKQLPYLTGLRAIASIMIQVAHIAPDQARFVSFFGFMALTTHFIQGGFLITASLLALQSRKRTKKGFLSIFEHVPQFFYNRWVRLYPALILLLAINSAWWYYRYPDSHKILAKLVFGVFFKVSQLKKLQPPDYPPNPWANCWFLDVQEHFYILWAFLLPFIARVHPRIRFIVLSILFGYSFYRRTKEERYNATLPLNLWKMVAGASILLLPLPRIVVMHYADRASLVVILVSLAWGFSPRFQDGFTAGQHRLYGDVFAVILVMCLTLASIGKALKKSDPKVTKVQEIEQMNEANHQPWYMTQMKRLMQYEPLSLLDSDCLNFIGRVSYSWYLWQVPIMQLEYKFCVGWAGFGPTSEAFIIALISTFLIEEPIKNIYVGYMKRKRQAAIMEKKLSPADVGNTRGDPFIALQMPLAADKNHHKE
ncbi:uncharacterized protein FA14DRAFT_192995 [Meira miltonrushii]|uniref:Acyltransferase 3 domain-containing protein n=1 Tax=Meira miltonrushii TaxID=1280837 RepID=A0A316V1G2_9BASI|nr:uncharacterized protein FA14DRAFT_192995 [Meira miltonrushii]PWN31389.1 hypothetical protein FA14DRAFT_192995 [Meira miltonrushii]